MVPHGHWTDSGTWSISWMCIAPCVAPRKGLTSKEPTDSSKELTESSQTSELNYQLSVPQRGWEINVRRSMRNLLTPRGAGAPAEAAETPGGAESEVSSSKHHRHRRRRTRQSEAGAEPSIEDASTQVARKPPVVQPGPWGSRRGAPGKGDSGGGGGGEPGVPPPMLNRLGSSFRQLQNSLLGLPEAQSVRDAEAEGDGSGYVSSPDISPRSVAYPANRKHSSGESVASAASSRTWSFTPNKSSAHRGSVHI